MARRFVLGAAGARKLRALLNGRGESGSVRGAGAGLTFEDGFAPPFTVQWAQSAANGEGSWIIWLPGSRLVMAGNNPLDPSAELDDVGGDYPEGWYILDDETLDRAEGGTLYLNIAFTGSTNSATFADHAVAPSGSSDTAPRYINVRICKATVEESGERKVEQYVKSAIVFWNGGAGDYDNYFADERSVSRCGQESTDPTQIFYTNYFHIYGFGKFTVPGHAVPVGTFQQATDLEIDPESDESTNVAFLVRSGNSSNPDSNFIGYRKLKIKGSAGSSPFAYTKSTTTSGGTTVTLHKLVNCCFYWNGELQSLADYDVSGLMGGGTVYLRGVQTAPSASDPDPDWTWTLGTAEQDEPSGGKALNIKLYDFAQSKVAVDYRTTFLAMTDHTQKAKITVGKPGGDASIELDASGNSPKLVITDGTKTVTIDLADIANDCNGNFGLHELKYKDKNGDEQVYHGLFCDDIDLSDIQAGKTIKDVSAVAVGGEPGGTKVTFTYSDGTTTEFTISNGLKGRDGSDGGGEGEAPEITAVRDGHLVHIYADGELLATISDGHTPVITATKSDGITTIYVDGHAIATIADGSGGEAELPDRNIVTDVTFAITGGKLVATLAKENLKTGATSQVSKDVCNISELDVVVSEAYSTSTHQFTNARKRIQVVGSPTAAQGQTPFTATPLSSE